MDPIIEALLQTGGLAIIAYFLIQYQREQAKYQREQGKAHSEELKALFLQTSIGMQEQSRQQRAELITLTQNNADALRGITAELSALENSILELAYNTHSERNLAKLKEMLCPLPAPQTPLPSIPSPLPQEEPNG